MTTESSNSSKDGAESSSSDATSHISSTFDIFNGKISFQNLNMRSTLLITLLGLITSALCLSIFPSLTSRHLAAQPVIQTTSGRIHGLIHPSYPSVSQFLNIPFAQPPLGALRFAPPAPLPSTAASQDINSTNYGPICLQYNPLVSQTILYSQYNRNFLPKDAVVNASSEDCLSLAIWAPSKFCTTQNTKKHTAESLPVLVWFFGGGFTKGGVNTDYYNGAPWVQRTQAHIIVAVNYRTNYAGTPNSAGLAKQGKNLNFGYLDQRLAIEWVWSNIAQFGGNPAQITIWGQSAGSISVDMYNFAYANDSLVSGLIMSSGTSLYPRVNKDASFANFSYAAAHMGCGTLDPVEEIECMRKVPTEKFKAFTQNLSLPGTLDFYPVVDNVTTFAFSEYSQRIKDGRFSKKPAIIGTAAHEGNAYIPVSGPAFPNATMVTLSNSVTYPAFLCPAIALTALRDNASVPTYRYLYKGNFSNISPMPWQSAYHASELPLVFGTYNIPTEPGTPTIVTKFEKQLSRRMQDLWLAFMKNPNGGLDKLGWPRSSAGATDGGSVVELAPQEIPGGPVLMQIVGVKSLNSVCST